MTIKEKKIIEALPASPGTAFDFKGVYVDAEGASHNVTVFDTEYFITNVIQLYRNRRLVIDEDQEGYLANLFRIWRSSREDLYIKQAYAYTIKYNPIDDYHIKEVMTDDVTEHEKGASYKNDYHNTDTETLTPFQKETTETTPYETKTETTPYETKTETTPFETKTETTPYETKTETTPYETKVEKTPYDKEKTTTTPTDTTTNATSAFNASGFTDTDKTTRGGKIEEELVITGTETVETTYNDTKETVETTHNNTKETVETTHNNTKETVETTHNNTKETVETTHNNTKEKVEKTYTGTQQTTDAHTGYIEHTTDGKDTDTRNYNLDKSGNIGWQTAAELLKQEYDNLIQDLAHRALYEFISRYTWYSEEVS